MIVRYVKRDANWKVTHFWSAKYVRERLTVTTGAVRTPGEVIHDRTYATHQDAYRTGASMMRKLHETWMHEDAEPPEAVAKPSAASRSKGALPKWLSKIPSQLAKIEEAIARAKLAHRQRDILALAKPSIRLDTKRITKWKGVISRMGGAPDVPPKGVALPGLFWLQLRCEDLAPFDLERVLPKKGVLSFFEDGVRYFPDERDLSPSKQHDDDDGPKAVAAIEASLELSLPPPTSAPTRALRLTKEEMKRYWDGVWLHHARGGHHVLGYPQMSFNERLKKGVVMLAQICADAAAKFEIGDAQPVRCYTTRWALAAKNFSRVVFTDEE
jgi:hypothetical protein